MRNANAAEHHSPEIPQELRSDHARFEAALDRSRLAAGITPAARSQLERLAILVHAEADRLALVARNDRPVLFTRHVLDSLNPLGLFASPPRFALDVGSGGGFPGLPLAIIWQKTQITLLEARERKAGFLERAVRDLGLGNVRVVAARLEEFGKAWIAPAQSAVFVRGVGGLPTVLRSATRASMPEGDWVYFLGSETDAAGLIVTLGPLGEGAKVTEGAFSGRLLAGRFPAARESSEVEG